MWQFTRGYGLYMIIPYYTPSYTLRLFNIASGEYMAHIEIDSLPIKQVDFPWLC